MKTLCSYLDFKWFVPGNILSQRTFYRTESHTIPSKMGSLVRWDGEVLNALSLPYMLRAHSHIEGSKTCESKEFCTHSLIPRHFSSSWLEVIFFNVISVNRQEKIDLKKHLLGNAFLNCSVENDIRGSSFYILENVLDNIFILCKSKSKGACACTCTLARTWIWIWMILLSALERHGKLDGLYSMPRFSFLQSPREALLHHTLNSEVF